jgi:hypothetical protein
LSMTSVRKGMVDFAGLVIVSPATAEAPQH